MFGDGGSGLRFVIARLVMAVVLVGGLIWWLMPGRGEEEFVDAQNALRKVRSWRVQATFESPDQSHRMLIEFACPSQDHTRRDVTFKDGHSPFHLETTHIGLEGFERMPNGQWKRRNGEFGPGYTVCRALLQGQDMEPMPPLLLFLKRGVIRKGERTTVGGAPCREWKVQVMVGPGQLETESICLGVEDHLPRRRIAKDREYIYYDWNSPVEIEAPALSDPPTL